MLVGNSNLNVIKGIHFNSSIEIYIEKLNCCFYINRATFFCRIFHYNCVLLCLKTARCTQAKTMRCEKKNSNNDRAVR